MRVDLHNHTYLCKHAVGSMEEYIQKAIEEKIDIFGFSDHNPMDFDKKHRMENEQNIEYIAMFNTLQEKYKNEIKLLFAYEFDFLDTKMNKKLLNCDVDYLIGSVHFIKDIGVGDPTMIRAYEKHDPQFKNKDANSLWEDYFTQIKKMAQSGYFNIVGHMDLVKVLTNDKPGKDIRLIAKDALVAIKKANMSIEINASGLRKRVKEVYPSKLLLQEAFSLGIPITFGSDSHAPIHVGYQKKYCEDLAKSVGYSQCVYYVKKQMISTEF